MYILRVILFCQFPGLELFIYLVKEMYAWRVCLGQDGIGTMGRTV